MIWGNDSFPVPLSPVIKTDRLVLDRLIISDSNEVFSYQSDKQNFIHVDMPEYTELHQVHTYISKMDKGIESNQWILWAVTDYFQIEEMAIWLKH